MVIEISILQTFLKCILFPTENTLHNTLTSTKKFPFIEHSTLRARDEVRIEHNIKRYNIQ